MYSHVGGESNTTDDEKEGIDSIEGEHSNWNGDALDYSRSDEVEEGQHGEYGDKHDVVDNGVVASEGLSNHVASQGQDDECQEELATESDCQSLHLGRRRNLESDRPGGPGGQVA